MYVSDIKIEKINEADPSWLMSNTNITIHIDTMTTKINTSDLQTIRPVCFVGDNGWGLVQQIARNNNTKILFDGEESEHLFIMDEGGRTATDIIDRYNNIVNDYPNNHVIICCPEIENSLSMNEQIDLMSKLKYQHNAVLLFNANTPFLIGDCFRKDVYLVDDEYKLTHPDFQTFGSSFDFILSTVFGLKTLITTRSKDFMQEAVNSNSIEEIKICLRGTGESFEKRFLYQKLEELKNS